jgi:ubiquinone/menaquinone biosynthesis C-methylase UbiE
MKKQHGSWGRFAKKYDARIEKDAYSYQHQILLPNIIRLVAPKKGETILDLACGQGFFSRAFCHAGARVIGVDSAREMITIARSRIHADFFVGHADRLTMIESGSIDKICIILALQNMRNGIGVFRECARVLRPHGKLFVVLNHPVVRIPRLTSWEFDEEKKLEYRRIDRYFSEMPIKIFMHPGSRPAQFTTSYHRPLQWYVKALKETGFCITDIEEWTSHKESTRGPRAKAENRARNEIPLFLFFEAQKRPEFTHQPQLNTSAGVR